MGNDISIPQSLLKSIEQPGSGVLPSPVLQLKPGQLIDVQIRQNPQSGQLGIYFNNLFLPALIPSDVKIGDLLTLKVQDNTHGLLLRIVDQSTVVSETLKAIGEKANGSIITLESFLRSIIDAPALKELQLGTLPIQERFALAFISNPDDLSNSTKKLLDLMHSLISKDLALSSATLDKPDEIAKLLWKFQNGEILESFQAIKLSLQADRQNEPSKPQFLVALDQFLNSLINSKEPLDFEQTKSNSKILEQTISLYLTKSHSSNEQLSARGLENFNSHQAKLELSGNPLLFLLAQLRWADMDLQSSNNPQDKKGLEIIRNLLTELNALRESKLPWGEVKESLKRYKSLLGESFNLDQLRSNKDFDLNSNMSALKALDSLFNSQEVISQLTPLLQSLNEPIPHFIPIILSGVLSKWQMYFHKPEIEENSDKQKQGGAGKGMQRIKLSLNLPNIGKVEVDLAHSKKELMLQLVFQDKSIAEYITSMKQDLEARFNELGFNQTVISAQHGEPGNATPQWLREITRNEVIA